MGQFYPSLTPSLTAWALKQPLFFVASAPLHGDHINVSPKGMTSTSFAVLSPTRVAYVDRTGSGCETLAHIYENGRATVMFCSFGPQPRILRLFCRKGAVIEADSQPAFDDMLKQMSCTRPPSARCIFVLDIFKVSTSCGYGVPRIRAELYLTADNELPEPEFDPDSMTVDDTLSDPAALAKIATRKDETSAFDDRPTLYQRNLLSERRGTALSYQQKNSVRSLDGLPALRGAMRRNGENVALARGLAYARRIVRGQWEGILLGFLLAVLVYAAAVGAAGAWPTDGKFVNVDMLDWIDSLVASARESTAAVLEMMPRSLDAAREGIVDFHRWLYQVVKELRKDVTGFHWGEAMT